MKSGALLEKVEVVTKKEILGCKAGFKVEVDFLVNRHFEVLNSLLISKYCELDQRFRKTALVLKKWMKDTNEDKFKRLNSFSVYMLLLAFMIHQKYLPNLQ